MRKYAKLACLISGLFFLSSCAWTTLNSIRNPKFITKKYKKILIVAPFSDLSLRQTTEGAFNAQLGLAGVTAIPSVQVFPPLKPYSKEEIESVLRENNIDAVLVVALQNYWNSQSYIPKSSSTRGSATLYGNSLSYQTYTQEYGGYYISKPRVTFEIRLYDTKTGEIVWLATSFTRGNAFANYNTLANSLAQAAVKRLIRENVVAH